MQRLEVSGTVRPIYGSLGGRYTTHIWVVRRQMVVVVIGPFSLFVSAFIIFQVVFILLLKLII